MSTPSSAAGSTLGERVLRGAVAGLFAAVFLGGLDALASAEGVARQFDSPEQRLWFALLAVLAPVPVLLLWGAAQAALAHALAALAHALAALGRRAGGASLRTQYRWMGRLGALLATPAVVWLCGQVFSGPRAQLIPGRRLLAGLLGMLAVAGLNLAIQLALRLGDWVRAGARRRRALTLALPIGALLVLGYLADRRVLPRLYPWFHLSLQVALVLGAQLAAGLLLAASARRRVAALLAVAGLGLLGGGWAVHRLQRAQTLRGLALEHTSLVAQILRGDSAVRGHRRALPPPPELIAEPDALTPPPFAGPRLAGRDVFLITVDALRFDRVSAATMPFVASLLPQAVVFRRAYTQVPHTSFAIATLLTGKPVYALMTLGQDAGSHETLPLILRRFRYKTAAFYPPSVFYVEHERLRRLEESAYGFEYVKFEYLAAPQRTAQLMRFLEEEQPPRVFAWVHYLEPHEPYDSHPGGPDPSRPDRERYDGEVRFIDDELRRLCDYLRRTRPSALLILAADHGEEFGEHGGRYHGTSLYEEQVHVPLVIVDLANLAPATAAGAAAGGPVVTPRLAAQQLDQPVGLIDVAPTVLGLLDIEPSVRMRGHDLAPWLLTRAATLPLWPVFSEIGRKKMVVRGDQKLICDFAADSCQAFALKRDPQERRSILESAPASAAELRLSLDRFIAEARRFEEAPADRTPAAAAERSAALSRGRMGDRGALPVLVALATDARAPRAQRQSALAVVAQLTASVLPSAGAAADALLGEPPLADPTVRAGLRELFPAASRATPLDLTELRWAAVLRLRLRPTAALPEEDAADREAQQAVAALLRDERADSEQRLAAALALLALPQCRAPAPGTRAAAAAKLDCVDLWLAALPAAMSLDDPDRVRPLLLALGRTRDARAVPTLLALVEPAVRSRPDLVGALGLSGQPAAVPAVAELLASDPYVPVRAAAATALGRLGGPAAQSALLRAQSREREQQVLVAIAAALAGQDPAPTPDRAP